VSKAVSVIIVSDKKETIKIDQRRGEVCEK
jgi:hypothetical protein